MGAEITQTEALALASSNLEKLLGLDGANQLADLVVTEAGGPFDFGSKIVGVISPRSNAVDIF